MITITNNFDDALKDLLLSLSNLRDLGIISNQKDLTSQIGEWLVAMLYDGQKATSGNQKDWDVVVGDKYYQVKAHAKAITTKAKFSSVKLDPLAQIDELVIIVFTSDYKLKAFYKMPWSQALHVIKKEVHKDVIYWNHIKNFQIPLDSLPKQDIITLFR